MKKIYENIVSFCSILIGVILVIIALPFSLLWSLFELPARRAFDKRYAEFLRQNDGKNFFCYNNRKNSREYIEQEIIPQLHSNIEIIYLNGKMVETPNYPKDLMSTALHNLKNYSKFPHLMKIRQAELIDQSINSLFFSVRNQNKTKSQLLTEIHDFFEADKTTVETVLSNSEG